MLWIGGGVCLLWRPICKTICTHVCELHFFGFTHILRLFFCINLLFFFAILNTTSFFIVFFLAGNVLEIQLAKAIQG